MPSWNQPDGSQCVTSTWRIDGKQLILMLSLLSTTFQRDEADQTY
jgi:hypothetical protein